MRPSAASRQHSCTSSSPSTRTTSASKGLHVRPCPCIHHRAPGGLLAEEGHVPWRIYTQIYGCIDTFLTSCMFAAPSLYCSACPGVRRPAHRDARGGGQARVPAALPHPRPPHPTRVPGMPHPAGYVCLFYLREPFFSMLGHVLIFDPRGRRGGGGGQRPTEWRGAGAEGQAESWRRRQRLCMTYGARPC